MNSSCRKGLTASEKVKKTQQLVCEAVLSNQSTVIKTDCTSNWLVIMTHCTGTTKKQPLLGHLGVTVPHQHLRYLRSNKTDSSVFKATV